MISKLAKISIPSPNRYSPRAYELSRISIHCMAGNLTVKRCGELFANPDREASSNYGIGSNGDCACYVDEKDGSWCTSNRDNDMRAITIEVANDGDEKTGWHVSDKAMDTLIDLLVDICKRNNKDTLVWFGDKEKSLAYKPKKNELLLTVHRWFANKACPGDYLYSKHPEIVGKVNRILGAKSTQNKIKAKSYKVKITADTLNVRKGAGTKYAIATKVKKNEVYTIVDEKSVSGTKWGKLKSGAGWISLKYTKKI